MCFFELAATPKNKINKHNKIPPASRVFLRTSPMHTRFYSGAKTQDQGGLRCRLWRLPTRWHHKVLLQFSHSVSLSVHTADTEGTKRHISKLVVKKKKDLGENHKHINLPVQLASFPSAADTRPRLHCHKHICGSQKQDYWFLTAVKTL